MKICIDPGHGGHDPGATFNGVLEKTIALEVARRLRDCLHTKGHAVGLTREADTYVPIAWRARLANLMKADIFICLHMNADPDEDLPGMKEARGAEIWIYPKSRRGGMLAQAIGCRLMERFPDEPWRGVKEEEFGVLVMTFMPAVLIEMGFIDHSETSRRMADPIVQRAMAETIAQGVEDYRETIENSLVV
jgi:N-acetylmuramoyl-L-alanine amidase